MNHPSAQSASEEQTLVEERPTEGGDPWKERRVRWRSIEGRQGVFEEPINPTEPATHSPQVPSVDQHSIRFNETQSGAFEQFTRFKITSVEKRMLFNSSELPFTREELIPVNRNSVISSNDLFTSSINTANVPREEESNSSNTIATQVRWEELPELRCGPEGRSVEVCDNWSFDRNKISDRDEYEVKYPNW
jgi:hypothetical protein